MDARTRQALVSRLRDSIEAIETRRPQGAGEAVARAPEAAPYARLDPHGLHEIWSPSTREGGAGLSFALGQGRGLLSPARPVLFWLGLGHEGSETGLPYAPGLAQFGLRPAELVLVRAVTVTDLLWAAEEIAASPIPAGVILECAAAQRALDFTALRRLALRSAESGTAVFLLRYGEEREASAARTRWRIAGFPSARHALDGQAPGRMRWQARLEKAPRGQRGDWVLSWAGEAFIAETIHVRNNRAQTEPARAPHPGAALPVLGHRLPQTG